mgnify:CR=1 FL=1
MQKKVQIRTKIFLIVLVAVIPTVVIALCFALFYQRSYINEKATQIANLCEGFTNEQRLIVRNAEETLLAISQTRAVQERDYGVLNSYLQDLMKVYPDYAVLLVADSSGTVMASGVNKTGYSLSDRSYFRYAMQTGQFTPGQYIVSRSTGEDAVSFTLPARTRSGEMVYLICSFNLDKYSRELSLDRLPEGATLEIFDYFGIRLFSNSSDEHGDPGSRVSEDLFMHALLATGSSTEKVALSGIPYLAAMGVVRENGLSIHVSVRMPYDRILSESYAPVVRSLLLMLLSCLAAFGLSLWLARRLFVGRIERLTAYTRALADGNLSIRSEINSSRDEVTDLIESFNKMASALEERDRSNERTLAEKEQLLLELQKRVSDNLQLLSSMVNLQVGHASDEGVRHALTTTHSRVMALALVYETIYRYSDVQRVQMHRYCVGLCEYLASLYSDVGSAVTSSVSGIDVALPIEKALPLALILNELVSNSLLHAFPNNAQGTIRIAFERERPALLKMTLCDDGVGFEDDVRQKGTFGYEMVEALVEQLHGALTLQSGSRGSEITVRFPDE